MSKSGSAGGDGPVAVAMSGGVDSSVAAALLAEAGHDVFGITMRLGLADIAGRPCCGEEEALLARRVCDTLGIRHVVVDIADEFREQVVEPFCDAYAAGLTPNPCVRCNERIKFGALAERVWRLGATSLATGHYARLERDASGAWLARAADQTKDQSYFLYRIAPETLERLVFPLGELTKAEVRALAAERGLPTAARRDSQEVCFTGDHAELLAATHPEALAPGPIEDTAGEVLGTHRGIARYTVGQRKGIGLGGPEGPWRVARIDAARNAVVVAPAGEATTAEVTLAEPVWRLGDGAFRALAQVRYRARPVATRVEARPDALSVRFDEPVAPLAPGQSLVLYEGDRVLGGGIVNG
jgi:tRNA-specific 2-thiouridylase